MFITRDDPDDRQRHADPRGQLVDAEEREREAVDPDPEARRDRGGGDLAGELLPPGEAAEVVDRADGRRDGGAEQEPAHLVAERSRNASAGMMIPRKSASPPSRGTGALVQPPPLGPVDDAEEPRDPADRRRQQHDDDEREERPVEDLGVSSRSSSTHDGPYFVP